ncbi:MAG TPA: hypothetical protein VFT64_00755 [Rickettsiales bacterium]|nr:hypothetical protein [Rickettsiales bacterium]
MAETTTNKQHDKQQDKQIENELGISKNVYAAGNAVKQGFIATAGLFVAIFALLQYGDKIPLLGKAVKPLTKAIKALHDSHYGLAPLYKKITGNELKSDEGIGAVIAVSFVASGLLSHFFQIAGVKSGRGRASAAIEKYHSTLAENQQLKQELAQYQSGQSGASQSAPAQSASATEQGQSHPQETTEAANSNSGFRDKVPQQNAGGFSQGVEQAKQQEPALAGRH